MENLQRQLEEIEVLEAIYPDELTVDVGIIESARQCLEDHDEDSGLPETTNRLSFTMCLAQLASLEHGGKLKLTLPSITVEFPPEYPEVSPPIVTHTSGLDTRLMAIVQTCFEDHSGDEIMMQLFMAINEEIQTRNESTVEDYESGIQQKEQTKQQSESAKANDAHEEDNVNSDFLPVIGRRIINSPYILKPAKIKDIKKCADELKLGGYVKIGKPGIIVIEGHEEGCQQYCPMLEDRGWKYQKVQGAQTEEGPAGGTIDDLRKLPKGNDNDASGFEVLGEDATVSDLGKLCREAGLADLFFTSLNIHDSSAISANGKGNGGTNPKGSGRKGGKR